MIERVRVGDLVRIVGLKENNVYEVAGKTDRGEIWLSLKYAFREDGSGDKVDCAPWYDGDNRDIILLPVLPNPREWRDSRVNESTLGNIRLESYDGRE